MTQPENLNDPMAAAFAAAETVSDPLYQLVERTKEDPGAAFTPEVVAALARLRSTDLSSFQRIRHELKTSRCKVTALDEAIRAHEGPRRREPTQPDILLELAQGAKLFHTADRNAYAELMVDGHRETWKVNSEGFKLWLRKKYYEATKGAPTTEAMQSVVQTLEAVAQFAGETLDVFLRVASANGKFYIDLTDAAWRAIEVDANGWRIVAEPPVRFRRTSGMLQLPEPERSGDIALLRPFLNVRSEQDFVLVVSWLLAALRSTGPYPVLVVAGEQGSAKSTFTKILRSLIDPNASPLRVLSRDDRDMFITATNGHVLAFDNVSGISHPTSDTLCRISTGAGFSTRRLYTDGEEMLFNVTRPIVLNGIEDCVSRPDLADRSIFLNLRSIDETSRKTEEDFWADFEQVHAAVLGALLSGISTGIARENEIVLQKQPRMADFAKFATACETAFWPEGTFEAAYATNRRDARVSVLDQDAVAIATLELMRWNKTWEGTATELLQTLWEKASIDNKASRDWPGDARSLSGRLRRLAPFFREMGVEIEFNIREGHARHRKLRITSISSTTGEFRWNASAASAASAR